MGSVPAARGDRAMVRADQPLGGGSHRAQHSTAASPCSARVRSSTHESGHASVRAGVSVATPINGAFDVFTRLSRSRSPRRCAPPRSSCPLRVLSRAPPRAASTSSARTTPLSPRGPAVQIAEQSVLSTRTVKSHLCNAMRKLGMGDRGTSRPLCHGRQGQTSPALTGLVAGPDACTQPPKPTRRRYGRSGSRWVQGRVAAARSQTLRSFPAGS